MLGFDAERCQDVPREVFQVEGRNAARARANGRGKNMPIVRVGQCQSRNERFVSGNKAIKDMSVHQHPGALKLLRFQIGSIFQNIPDPFVVNRIGPFGPVQF